MLQAWSRSPYWLLVISIAGACGGGPAEEQKPTPPSTSALSIQSGTSPAPASTTIAARLLTDRHVLRTPARMKRGQYLVESVAFCFLCHSETEWTRRSMAQPKPGLRGGGRTWEDYTDAPFLVNDHRQSSTESTTPTLQPSA